jgi:transposase
MAAQRKYPDELRERAVKMVLEIRERDGKGHGELARVGRQLGVHPEALRSWIKQAEIDGGERPGIGSGSPSWSVRCASSAALMKF